MYRVTKELNFCYGHRLLHYEGKCRFLHGHNGRAVITIEGPEVDERGMLVDFGDIRRTLGQWIEDHLDHHMVLHQDDPLVPILREHQQPMLILPTNPTAENIAKTLYDVASEAGFRVVEVQFWETGTSCATFHGSAVTEQPCRHANGRYPAASTFSDSPAT